MAHPDDIIVWPDGTEATREEVERGDYNWMSDDYEVRPQPVELEDRLNPVSQYTERP